MKKIETRQFQVDEGQTVKLKRWPTVIHPICKSKEECESLLQKHVEEMSQRQAILYAQNCYALLILFQAMDAAGKDGAIKHVMSGVNPQACQVYSFKQPSAEELEHDFLWRTNVRLPERGHLGIFNRSYYEEVLVVRVHPELLQKQHLPEDSIQDDKLWKGRYRSIVDLERHLHRNGTRLVKIFLHLSKEEQRKRLLRRIDDPEKNWKLSLADIGERKLWKEYQKAYEACLSATSTKEAPWYVVPADDKPNARLIVSQIILEHLSALDMHYPKTSKGQKRELEKMRKLLGE
jgi:PPK2 family polyphosphate:nucleotide phosphotransferase